VLFGKFDYHFWVNFEVQAGLMLMGYCYFVLGDAILAILMVEWGVGIDF